MAEKLDCKGLQCPFPVIKTKQELEKMESGVIEVEVDDTTPKNNLLKFAKSNGFEAEVIKDEEKDIIVRITKGEAKAVADEVQNQPPELKLNGGEIIFIKSEFFGGGEEELGRVLMKTFLFTLTEVYPLPQSIIFVNSGVKLSSINEDTVASLKKLEEAGVEILSCGLCLDYYKIKEDLKVGEVSNMYVIVEKLTNTGKVISI